MILMVGGSLGKNRPRASRRRFFEFVRPTGIWLRRETVVRNVNRTKTCALIHLGDRGLENRERRDKWSMVADL